VGLVAIALVASLAVVLAQFAVPELGIGDRARTRTGTSGLPECIAGRLSFRATLAGALHVDRSTLADWVGRAAFLLRPILCTTTFSQARQL
jgi:hypothetical protein